MTSATESLPPLANKRTHTALREIKSLIKRTGRDCGCSSIVGDLLRGLSPNEQGPVVRELFGAAVRQRMKVIALSELLSDVTGSSELPDQGELDEASMLFEDMAEQARLGSQFLRALSVHCSVNHIARPNPFSASGSAQ